MRAMKKSQVDKILDAAGAVVFKEGVGKLTIDGVAEKVGMSKGGVLYHFGTKDQLVEAMVQRTADQWREGFKEAYEAADEGPGRAARALLVCLSDVKEWTSERRDGSSAVFAALAYNPKLIAPMRTFDQELHQRLDDDELPPGVSQAHPPPRAGDRCAAPQQLHRPPGGSRLPRRDRAPSCSRSMARR